MKKVDYLKKNLTYGIIGTILFILIISFDDIISGQFFRSFNANIVDWVLNILLTFIIVTLIIVVLDILLVRIVGGVFKDVKNMNKSGKIFFAVGFVLVLLRKIVIWLR
jgi:hypothetical protein